LKIGYLTWPFSGLLDEGGTIFGVSSNKIGWGLSNKDTDNFLIAFIKPLKEKEGFAVMYDASKAV